MAIKPSRDLSGPFAATIAEHSAQIGQVIWGANFLQSCLLHIFEKCVCPGNRTLALAMWHSHGSDATQRAMLMAVAKLHYGENSEVFTNIVWILNNANQLVELRNQATHTLITMGEYQGGTYTVSPDRNSTRPAIVEKLLQKPIETWWEDVSIDFYVLGMYASFHVEFFNGVQPEMPSRPDLKVASWKPKTLTQPKNSSPNS